MTLSDVSRTWPVETSFAQGRLKMKVQESQNNDRKAKRDRKAPNPQPNLHSPV